MDFKNELAELETALQHPKDKMSTADKLQLLAKMMQLIAACEDPNQHVPDDVLSPLSQEARHTLISLWGATMVKFITD